MNYLTYAADERHMREYREYQERYASTLRESDRVLISIIRNLIEPHLASDRPTALLDVGCSTGNLLRHISHLIPGVELSGYDLAASIILENRREDKLAGIHFKTQDMLDLDESEAYDVVVANAALMFFEGPEFLLAIQNLGRAIRPGGALVCFDLFHPFEQDISLVECSRAHPDGLRLHFRPYATVSQATVKAGLSVPEFLPFKIPIDLPLPNDPGDITSHTLMLANGERLCFRGALAQHWCHTIASKPTGD